jgi:hypothetical protein
MRYAQNFMVLEAGRIRAWKLLCRKLDQVLYDERLAKIKSGFIRFK